MDCCYKSMRNWSLRDVELKKCKVKGSEFRDVGLEDWDLWKI